jgi:phospholipase C
MENHSFDNLWGEFPGVDGVTGLDAGAPNVAQVGADGGAYAWLPSPPKPSGWNGSWPFPDAGMPNAPFAIEDYVPAAEKTRDLHHQFFTEKFQIAGGKMNAFAYWSDARALVMGHYRTMGLPVPQAARDRGWTVCDHFFHAAFGGSFLNHQFLVAARAPEWPAGFTRLPPKELIGDPANVLPGAAEKPFWRDPSGRVYAVNTTFSENTPHPPVDEGDPATAPAALLPPQTHATIGDRLTDAGIDWAWYSGGWNDALAPKGTAANTKAASEEFQYHHQPFVYFARYAAGTPGRSHLRDEADFVLAARGGGLPPVSFVKPVGIDNEHPGYADVLEGEKHLLSLIDAVVHGPQAKGTVIVVAYDEHGGFWDHVAPPAGGEWGPGSRVPAVVITPWASGTARIDSTTYDTTSILATIERRFALPPLGERDAHATPMWAALGVKQAGATSNGQLTR